MNRYGLIGKSLGHSFSKAYFTQKFQAAGIDSSYENFELSDISELTSLIASNPNLSGLNVTIPFKEVVMASLHDVDAEAAAVGAVNTLVIKAGKIKGYNTDVWGFRESLKPFLAHGMERALILGTGGASRAVAYALRQLGIEILFVSRNPQTDNEIKYDVLNEQAMKNFRLVINTTPLGMYPDTASCPPLPYQYLRANHLLYDLVYNPQETTFIKMGKKMGAATTNGLAMLRLQADKSWEIWNQAAGVPL